MDILRKDFINPITISHYLDSVRDSVVTSSNLNYDNYTEDEGQNIIQRILRNEVVLGDDIILSDTDGQYVIVDGYKRLKSIEDFADGKLSCGTLFKMEDFMDFKLNILVVGEEGLLKLADIK